MEKKPYEITKSGLITIVVIGLAALLMVFYLFYKSGVSYKIMMTLFIGIIGGLGVLALVFFMLIKISPRLSERVKQLKDIKEYKNIRKFGILSQCLGYIILGNHDIIIKLLSLFWMAAGFGLIIAMQWGRYLFMVIATLSTLFIIIDSISRDSIHQVAQIASKLGWNSSYVIGAFLLLRGLIIGYCISGIYYLTRPKVKEQFK